MPQRPLLDTEFSQRFFADILSLYPGSDRRYDCPGISDLHYCQLGVLRCLDTATTGQQFLQHHADQNIADIDPGHYHHAASFDPKTKDTKGNSRAIATGHFFRLNLRTHLLTGPARPQRTEERRSQAAQIFFCKIV